jgi:hypothetical protein
VFCRLSKLIANLFFEREFSGFWEIEKHIVQKICRGFSPFEKFMGILFQKKCSKTHFFKFFTKKFPI